MTIIIDNNLTANIMIILETTMEFRQILQKSRLIRNKITKQTNKLSPKQKAFCRYYVELGNETQAALKAGDSKTTAAAQASRLLNNVGIQKEIGRISKPIEDKHIATAQEVMEFFTKMMNGEIKDQFGLDATNSDKIKAAQEIAKRTVDIENRANGKADAKIEIALDWRREE